MSCVDTSPCPASEEHDLSRARTPVRTSDPLRSTKCCACHAKPTGKAAETKGRQGVHPTPCKAASAALATQKLPAERRRPRDARAYIRPLAEQQVCACHAKATGRAAETKGRQGVHPTPCRAPSAAPATQKQRRPRDARAYIRPLAEQQVLRLPRKKQRRPRDARAYIRPLAEQQVPRLPRKTYRQSGGDQGTPRRTSDPLQSTKRRACHAKAPGDQGTPGRTSDPLHSTKCRARHAKATGRAAETKGRQGVHPTLCRAASLRLPRKTYRQSGGGRTSDPLQSSKCCACHAKATSRAAETKGRQGVHPTPCRAPSAAPATQNLPAKWRRAYIRPLAEQQVLRLPRKSYRQSGGDQGTPERTSDPLQSSKCCACHAKSSGDQGTPGRTSDPLQSTKCRACHAKECE